MSESGLDASVYLSMSLLLLLAVVMVVVVVVVLLLLLFCFFLVWFEKNKGYASGGVYVPCIYMHPR